MTFRILLLSLAGCLLLPGIFSCEQKSENTFPIFVYADSLDFEKSTGIDARLAEGFSVSLWAPEKLLAGPVGIMLDNQGVAYVSETTRRKSSDIDIRAHRDWMIEDLALSHIDSTRDFHLRKLATNLSAKNTWQPDLNGDSIHDFRDLTVESERIRVLKDDDKDGKADVSHIYAEDFRGMLTGVAGSVLTHEGKVYLTAAPDLWQLEDTDKDGDFDVKTSISHGYGIHIAYAGHDMSGLTLGPDGKIYWSIGDIGVNVKDADGKQWAYPNEGAVMRINPDGTEFEVFAHGLRNPQELAFDKYGNLISVDNDGDNPGERERYVHILEGSDTGWRINWQFGKYNEAHNDYKVWMDEKLYLPHFPGRPAYALPALALAPNGPAGLAYNPGTALNESWEDYFFASYFTGSIANSQIGAFKLSPNGASFRVEADTFIMSGIQSTGINFGPDGDLYMADWLEGYTKKDIGRIWKLKTTQTHSLQRQTKEILGKGMESLSETELSTFLAHADMRVRMEAQFELVRRKNADILLDVAQDSPAQLARLHAIWGLGQLARKNKSYAEDLLQLLGDSDAEVRAQTAKVIGDAHFAKAFGLLIKQLEDKSARAQYFAAEALGKIGNADAFDGLVSLLENTGEKDPHLRHGIVYALSKIGVEDKLGALNSHPSEAVRVGVVLALRELNSQALTGFLADDSWKVVDEAARAIHDDESVLKALPALAASLENSSIKTEAFLRRAINANLRVGGKDAADRLANFIQKKEIPQTLQADAVWALAYWNTPLVLDRVDGRYRETGPNKLANVLPAIARIEKELLKGSEDLRVAYLGLIGRLGLSEKAPLLFSIHKDLGETIQVRQTALNSLSRLKTPSWESAIKFALKDKSEVIRKEAQGLIGTLDIAEREKIELLGNALEYGSVEEKQTIFASLGDIEQAEPLVDSWLDKMMNGEVPAEIQLDILLAAKKLGTGALGEKIVAYEARLVDEDELGKFITSLSGGNARRGGRHFYIHETAQCMRCHQLEGNAVLAGPNLGGIASKLSRKELLEALVLPSKRISPGYGKQGVTSAMIPMQNFMTPKEIRDVVAFLNTLK